MGTLQQVRAPAWLWGPRETGLLVLQPWTQAAEADVARLQGLEEDQLGQQQAHWGQAPRLPSTLPK